MEETVQAVEGLLWVLRADLVGRLLLKLQLPNQRLEQKKANNMEKDEEMEK